MDDPGLPSMPLVFVVGSVSPADYNPRPRKRLPSAVGKTNYLLNGFACNAKVYINCRCYERDVWEVFGRGRLNAKSSSGGVVLAVPAVLGLARVGGSRSIELRA